MDKKYDSMTLIQLRELARDMGLKSITALKKSDLIEAIKNHKSDDNQKQEKHHKPTLDEHKDDHDKLDHGNDQSDQTMDSGKQDRKRSSHASEMERLDSGETKEGILEILPDGYGFIRCDNYLPGENDVYVSPAQIRRFNLKTGDIVSGNTRVRNQSEKFSALLYIKSVNGFNPAEAQRRKRFEDLTPIFPNERIHLETPGSGVSMRMVDLISPIGMGQRGMIVSQ
ncbi:MAG TPA: transcription termination factor Rho, partial [Clostridiales bacterium]|nr:transcription termination factor Rho [Clostridiales bacterium]